MSDDRAGSIADRKALLCARAELDRARLAYALHGILAAVAPEDIASVEPRAPWLAGFVGILASVFGARKIARWVRFASVALTALRFARNWRRSR